MRIQKLLMQKMVKVNSMYSMRPVVTPQQIHRYAEKYFGLIVDQSAKLSENDTYDDKSFIVEGKLLQRSDKSLNKQYEKNNKFVFKIFNTFHNPNIEVFQNLHKHLLSYSQKPIYKFQVPQAIQVLSGSKGLVEQCQLPVADDLQFENCTESELLESGILKKKDSALYASHIVRLTAFIPGDIIDYDRGFSDELVYNWGVSVGHLGLMMKSWNIPPKKFDLVWNIVTCMDQVRNHYIPIVNSEAHRRTLHKIVSQFEQGVLPEMQKHLPMQWIHSDPNEHNMLANSEAKIVGILDFDDCVHSYRVVDIATALMYITTGSDVNNILEKVKIAFRGYSSVTKLTDVELNALYHLMLMRYVASISVGEYQVMQEPENKYLLFTVSRAWERLGTLVNIGKENFLKQIHS